MAMRDGVVAAVLNRPGSLGPAAGKLSRGALPLLALRHGTAQAAVDALSQLDAAAYRTFNMVVADRHSVHFVRGLGRGRPEAWPLLAGVHVVTAYDPNDIMSVRAQAHLPRFQSAPAPDPATGDWSSWEALLSDRSGDRFAAINVPPLDGFGTICSSLVGLRAAGSAVWRFAAGPPDEAPFTAVGLP